MKTQEEYALEIDEIVRRDVESRQSDWFKIDKEIYYLIFILMTETKEGYRNCIIKLSPKHFSIGVKIVVF